MLECMWEDGALHGDHQLKDSVAGFARIFIECSRLKGSWGTSQSIRSLLEEFGDLLNHWHGTMRSGT